MKLQKTQDELVPYMWEQYPNDDQLEMRSAMLKAFHFLTCRYDQEEQERKKIALEIGEKLKLKFK
jgi:hypothetical protein